MPERRGARFLAHSGAGVIGNGAAAALALAYVATLGHRLGPAEYAVVAAALSVAYVLSLVMNPLESSVSKLAAVLHGQGDRAALARLAHGALARSVRPALVLLLGWLPLGLLLQRWLHIEGLAPLGWLGVLLALSLPNSLARGILRGDQRFVAYAVNQVGESALRLVVGVLAVLLGLRAGGALLGYAAGVGCAVALGLWQLRELRQPPDDGRDGRGTALAFSAGFDPAIFLCHLFLAFVVNADVIAAKHYLPAAEAGQYGAAASLARLIYLGATPVYQVLFAHVSARHAAGQSSRRLTVAVLLAMTLGLAAALVVPVLLGERLLALAFGPAFAGGAPALRLLWAATSLLVVEAAAFLALLGVNRSRGAWLFVLPCATLVALIALHHDSAAAIARASLTAVAAGGLVLAAMALLPARKKA